ncbi:MAG: hypothetical protein P1U56_06020 [Saprospiraceae bacterium]|nr:hypothetical protein [Saprospiraceae bacterium]
MIVKMKEIALFAPSSTIDKTIDELGKLGVVEIREVRSSGEEHFRSSMEAIENTEKAISVLRTHAEAHKINAEDLTPNVVDPIRLINRLLMSIDVKKKCVETIEELSQQLKWYETWGEDMNTTDLKDLNEKGIYVRLYQLEQSDLEMLPENHCLIQFPKSKDNYPVALFTRDAKLTLGHKEDIMPKLRLKSIHGQLKRKKRQLERVHEFLSNHLRNLPLLEEYLEYIQDGLKSKKALEGMGNIDGAVNYLKGFIPHDKSELIKEKAKENSWGYEIKDPENYEEVPVYIKNPSWINIINPVMKFIDIVPGYKEVDVSIYFLVAFALFFAMLVGDAGYGAIFLLTAILFRKKITPQLRILIYVLSGSTIIWGILSGTYFGSEYIAALPGFNDLIVPEIASFGVDNISFMMHLSFLIGAIHLTIAHVIRIFQYSNSIKLLSEVGWIALIWALFFVAEKLVLGKEIPEWNNWLFLGGAILVIFFSQAGKTLTSSIMSSVANLPLSLINGFSDIVSYVRLFAVGMATATVATSFNGMIIPADGNLSFLGILIAIVALALGHGLNIVLALMAVMVHGIRLNMLEFSGHLGVRFSGEAYHPFSLPSLKNGNSNHKKK